ncbi:MAG: hypothetical protein ACKPH7_10205, partial [Planktothrix sp.]
MVGTPKSMVLLLGSCIAAIAAVGSVFELSSGDPQLVVKLPSCGSPEESSKTEPTAAIAAIQDPNNKTMLFGVPT